MHPVTIGEVNGLDTAGFVAAFGGVAEHSLWVAARAAQRRPFASREDMIQAFAATLAEASHIEQLRLILAHPDLAGRAAVAGALTADSRREQADAGLSNLTPEEYASFMRLNEAYRDRFGFPFVYAVRGAGKGDILAAFEARLEHDRATEFATALGQIARIFRFRIEDRVAP